MFLIYIKAMFGNLLTHFSLCLRPMHCPRLEKYNSKKKKKNHFLILPLKKNIKLWTEEIRILTGVKKQQKKKKQFILEHVIYTHISNNEFLHSRFTPGKKKMKSIEVRKYAWGKKWKKKIVQLSEKINFSLSHFTPNKKKMKNIKVRKYTSWQG